MTSASSGWLGWPSVNGQGNGGALAVARSTDQGRTWVNVTPRATLKGEALSLVPMGPETAFLIAVHPGRSATVYVTHDGGTLWTFGRPVSVRFGQGGAYLSSFGPNVWLEVGGPYRPQGAAAQLLASQDGGYTWQLVAETGAHPSTIGTLPGFGWVVFTGEKVGFTSALTLSQSGNSLELYRTTDDGKSWVVEPVPGLWISIGPPRFSGNSGLAESFPWSEQFPAVLFLGTSDAGKKWEYQGWIGGATADVVSGESAVAAPALGAMAAPGLGAVDFTTNGARTWQEVSPLASQMGLFHSKQIVDMSFVSMEIGWALIAPKTNPNIDQVLYLTTDGGARWQEMAK